jgi:hypothetical protein
VAVTSFFSSHRSALNIFTLTHDDSLSSLVLGCVR